MDCRACYATGGVLAVDSAPDQLPRNRGSRTLSCHSDRLNHKISIQRPEVARQYRHSAGVTPRKAFPGRVAGARMG